MRSIVIRILISIAALVLIGISINSYLVSYPQFALKGRLLAFGCNGQLYVIRDDGSEKHLLLPGMYQNLSSPTWSPDGQQIAFARKHNPELAINNGITIESVNLMNPGLRLITGTLQYESWGPTWSPDGQWILFMSDAGPKPGWDMYRVHPDGTGLEQITNSGDSGSPPGEPDWSPTGEQIVYREFTRIFIMDADGSHNRLLIDAETQAASPSWSPDGEWIAFVENPAWQQFTLSRIRVDGTEHSRIVTFRLLSDPAWSPDGEWIAFTAQAAANPRELLEIWKIHPDGTGLEQITYMSKCEPYSPTWSPVLK